jgi:ornithine decarboxylase
MKGLKYMEYKLLGLPMHHGADSIGLNFGINELKKLEKEKNYYIEKLDIVTESESFENKYIKYINSIVQNCENLAKKVNDVVSSGKIPITIGGDHSIAMGSILGVAKEKEIGVMWVDAHGDSNTDKTTVTGNIHGMPLAAVQGYGHEKLINIFNNNRKIKSENIVIFGARDLDYREKLFIEKLGIKIVYFTDIEKNGLESEFSKAITYLTERVNNNIHLSFDLDVINPKILPGVSIPVEGGITLEQAEYIFDYFINNNLLSSADIVEYNPIFDENHITRDFVIKIIRKFYNKK